MERGEVRIRKEDLGGIDESDGYVLYLFFAGRSPRMLYGL